MFGCPRNRGNFIQPVRRSGAFCAAPRQRPVVARYRERDLRRYFRADAAFANPEVYEFLEAEGYKYAIRLPAKNGAGRPRLTRNPAN